MPFFAIKEFMRTTKTLTWLNRQTRLVGFVGTFKIARAMKGGTLAPIALAPVGLDRNALFAVFDRLRPVLPGDPARQRQTRPTHRQPHVACCPCKHYRASINALHSLVHARLLAGQSLYSTCAN